MGLDSDQNCTNGEVEGSGRTTPTHPDPHHETMVVSPPKRKRGNDDHKWGSSRGQDSDASFCSHRGGMGLINTGFERLVTEAVDAKVSKLSERDDTLRQQTKDLFTDVQNLRDALKSDRTSNTETLDAYREEVTMLKAQKRKHPQVRGNTRKQKYERRYVTKETVVGSQATLCSLEDKFNLKLVEQHKKEVEELAMLKEYLVSAQEMTTQTSLRLDDTVANAIANKERYEQTIESLCAELESRFPLTIATAMSKYAITINKFHSTSDLLKTHQQTFDVNVRNHMRNTTTQLPVLEATVSSHTTNLATLDNNMASRTAKMSALQITLSAHVTQLPALDRSIMSQARDATNLQRRVSELVDAHVSMASQLSKCATHGRLSAVKADYKRYVSKVLREDTGCFAGVAQCLAPHSTDALVTSLPDTRNAKHFQTLHALNDYIKCSELHVTNTYYNTTMQPLSNTTTTAPLPTQPPPRSPQAGASIPPSTL